MEIKSISKFIEIAKTKPLKKLAVAAAEDKPVLKAVAGAMETGAISPLLVGDAEKIKAVAGEIEFDLKDIEIIDEKDSAKAALKAVETVRGGDAQILMKGHVQTADFLRAVLHKEKGLRTNSLLSHIGFFEMERYHKVIALTDAAQNTFPELSDKIKILNNSVDMMSHLGIENPKVALLAAIEGVNPKMPNTLDAAAMTMMNKRGQIKNCIIDGPLALDNAVSKEAAEHKGIVSDVAGDADLLFAPNIEVANVIYKTFNYLCGATAAACILGAAAPIVLTSRADNENTKLMSIALAAAY
jgi:phosphate butyryltransferase